MLTVLAKNPVFAANPECLAGFVQTLVQPRHQSIPTPMSQPMGPSTVVKPENSPLESTMVVKREGSAVEDSQAGMAPVQRGDSGAEDSQATIEARKQFWSKFKRLRPADPHFSPEPPSPAPTAAASPAETDYGDNGKSELKLCGLPTLVLGEEATDSPEGGSSEVVNKAPTNGDISQVEVLQSNEDSHKAVLTDDAPASGVCQAAGGAASASNPEEAKDAAPTLPDPSPGSPVVASQQPDQKPEGVAEALPEALQVEVPEPVLVETPQVDKGEQQQPDVAEPAAPETGETRQPNTTRSNVAEALKRVNTVDLTNGKTPAPPQSLVSVPNPPVSTVVLLNVGGVVQPVTVPMSPHQCRLAGMTIANDPDASAPDHGQSNSAVPVTAVAAQQGQQNQETEVEAVRESEDLSEKQMLKNIYMRFSRSQKRSLIAVPLH